MIYKIKKACCSILLVYLCTSLVFFPSWSYAKVFHRQESIAPPAATALPVLHSEQVNSAGWSVKPHDPENPNYLQVDQTANKAIIQWQSFDIGKDAHAHFEQGEGGIAFNRIRSADPSRIFGQLSATGSIYLVNQNGILFGPDSRTDLNSLVASSLNINDDDFLNGLWRYQAENYMGDSNYQGPGDVVNQGEITSANGGNIFLLGPGVENRGTISSEEGKVYLAGGDSFEWEQTINAQGNVQESFDTDYTGVAANTDKGKILIDAGKVGIYGRIVQHDGLIRSLTTVQKGSFIELVASERISTGEDSRIKAEFKELDEPSITESASKVKVRISNPENESVGQDWDSIFVEHRGEVELPSGIVSVNAGDDGRIYLAPGSSIDVSGTEVYGKSAADKIISLQENSLELRDEFLQKNGILKGETINFLIHEGISIGNASGHLSNRNISVDEYYTEGGRIELTSGSGDIIVDSEASLDISGGFVQYDAGAVTTTKLISNGIYYDISEAPDWLVYDGITNEGVGTWLPDHKEGSDAGTLKLTAKQIVYEGDLQAGATTGYFQINPSDPVDELGYAKSLGTAVPLAGTLEMGGGGSLFRYSLVDPIVDAIVIKESTNGLDQDFDPETSPIPLHRNGETWLSDDLLTNSGVGNIGLNATKYVITEPGTQITLSAQGSMAATARRIYHQGNIAIPGGTVEFRAMSNKTTDQFDFYRPGVENPYYISEAEIGLERVELAGTSSISTAGEKFNNYAEYRSGNGGSPHTAASVEGGSIILKDTNVDGDGVVVRQGAELDVSGGYLVSQSGETIDSGDAGSIEVLGPAIVLEGNLKGHSMIGKQGGSVALHARETIVTAGDVPELPEGYSSDDPLPADLEKRMVLEDSFFDRSGFTTLSLASLTDITIEENAAISPSRIKLELSENLLSGQYTTVADEFIGQSEISLSAGSAEGYDKDYIIDEGLVGSATVTINNKASLTAAPGGSVKVDGPEVYIDGMLRAYAGIIDVSASALLAIGSKAEFLANGYNRQTEEYISSHFVLSPENGGNITFSSDGTLIIEDGAVIDVSGFSPVTNYRRTQDGYLRQYTAASEPGSISLSFLSSTDDQGKSLINADFLANRYLDHLRGGSFSMSKIDYTEGLTTHPGLMNSLSVNGFDQLTLTSFTSINFSEDLTIDMPRGINLYAPVLQGTENTHVVLNTEWARIINTGPPLSVNAAGGSQLTVNTDYLDIEGAVNTTGFSDIFLNAQNDIRLTDRYYNANESAGWGGSFLTPGNLSIRAARIYPTTGSVFEIIAGGKISTSASDITPSRSIYSALGSLTLKAEDIEHRGFLAAPMGQLTLDAENRIYLSDESVLSVAGEAVVNYGEMDETNLKWYGYDKETGSSGMNKEITSLPEKKINITAREFIGRESAEIDVEGGGGAYGYVFLPGTDGTVSPLDKSGRFVILPSDSSMGNFPGPAVFLEENALVDQGIYTLLPEQYAFIEGAKIIEFQESLGTDALSASNQAGYATVVGYDADQLTGQHSSSGKIYTIREASDVLSEGNFEMTGLVAGDAGSIKIEAETNVMNSMIKAEALDETYRSGVVTLSGRDIIFSSASADLGSGFDFNTQFEDTPELNEMVDKLFLDAGKLSESGLWKLNIGSSAITESITFEEGSSLESTRTELTASGNISFKQNAGIQSTGEAGSISLLSTDGRVTMDENSFLRSSSAIHIDAKGLDRNGEIRAENAISLSSDYLYLSDSDHESSIPQGLIVDQEMWQSFSDLEKINLTGREELGFAGYINLTAQNAVLNTDSPLIANVSDDQSAVVLNVREAHFLNADTGSVMGDAYTGNQVSFSVHADRINIGYGSIGFSGFSDIIADSAGSLTFIGKGSFNTNGADLGINSSVVTGKYHLYTDDISDEINYDTLDYEINAGTGNISITQIGAAGDFNDNIGGSLTFTAERVDHSGALGLTSGVIKITATGTGIDDGVYIHNGAEVSAAGAAAGEESFDGGTIQFESANGVIRLASGSLTDVSAGNGTGNAGTISVYNPNGLLDIEGGLSGTSHYGSGGTFLMDTGSAGELSSLILNLQEGGFSNRIEMRFRSGDAALNTNINVHNFKLSTDEGDIQVGARIDASSADGGGVVEIYSGGNLTLSSNAEILAAGTNEEANGGEIVLGGGINNNGQIRISGSSIDISGGVLGKDGKLYLRVPQTQEDLGIGLELDTVLLTGIDQFIVEGVQLYQDSSITYSDLTTWGDDAADFMENFGNAAESLLSNQLNLAEGVLSILPGIEVQSTETLDLDVDMDLTSWRFGTNNRAASLTFKAAGDLNINGNILDHPTVRDQLLKDTAKKSTRLNFAAGSQLANPDIFAVNRNMGNLSFANGTMVYTEGGDIQFASGGDTTIGSVSASNDLQDYMTYNDMRYNIASYTGKIHGNVLGDMIMNGGVIQTATGDIEMNIGKNLKLKRQYIRNDDAWQSGTIRTTGQPPSIGGSPWDTAATRHGYYHEYSRGGSIQIRTGGDISTLAIMNDDLSMANLNPDAWETVATKNIIEISEDGIWTFETETSWSPDFDGISATQGIVTMGDGNIDILSGGRVFGQAGTFGDGDLNIKAGSDIDGFFVNKNGTITLRAMDSIGTLSQNQVIEAFDSRIYLSAQGNITWGTVLNPTIANRDFRSGNSWNMLYTPETSLLMTAGTGDITLTGLTDPERLFHSDRSRVIPPVLYLSAGRDVAVQSSFYLPPSEIGNIVINARRDITGKSVISTGIDNRIVMSDMDPAQVYGNHPGSNENPLTLMNDLKDSGIHAAEPVHRDDSINATFTAGSDIKNIQLVIPKAAELRAGRDISNINYIGQTNRETDETIIYAARNIYFETEKGKQGRNAIVLGGSGKNLVQAGNNIDLGSSPGVQSLGSLMNPYIPRGENDLMLIAGIADPMAIEDLEIIFDDLRQAGLDFIEARSNSDEFLSQQIMENTRESIIDPLFENSGDSTGNINLVNSRVFTSGGEGDIFTIARGEVNVGLSSIAPAPITGEVSTSSENSGFYTTAGGAIKMFAKGDINVNESRIMTFSGGDIDVMSDAGNINAGRGSKVAVASSTTSYIYDEISKTYKVVFEPPAVGSGIRATAPSVDQAGDIYALAWEGYIDAGEAGIAGRNVALGAKEIRNVQNIQTTGFALGFTKPSESSAGIGGITGGGGLADTGLATEENSQMTAAKKRFNEPLPEGYSFEPRWVDIEVVDFEKEDEEEDDE